MSVRALYTVWCDGPECLLWVSNADTQPMALAEAKAWRWTRVDGHDFCPRCSASRLREVTGAVSPSAE